MLRKLCIIFLLWPVAAVLSGKTATAESFVDPSDTVQKIYIAYYLRPADPGGLGYWSEQLSENGRDITGIIDAYAASEESKRLWGEIHSGNIAQMIDRIYRALFDRQADAAGREYYVKGFKSGRFTPGTIVLDILFGAQNEDAASIANKVAYANHFVSVLDPDGDYQGPYRATYDSDDEQAARDLLAEIKFDSASITEMRVEQDIIEYIADAGDLLLVGISDPAAAIAEQNKAAEEAVDSMIDMASGIEFGRTLIVNSFGSIKPSAEEVEDFVEADPGQAEELVLQLSLLTEAVNKAADGYNSALEDLTNQEKNINTLLGETNGTVACGIIRDGQKPASATLSVATVLGVFSLLGAGAAAAKGASDAMHECHKLPDCTSHDKPSERVYKIVDKLECMINKWPKCTSDAVKATVSTGTSMVASWAAGIKEWTSIKFFIDAYSTWDTADSIKKLFGIRSCSQPTESMQVRALQDSGQGGLLPDEVYIGTSEDGTFHNIPKGSWTFLVLEDGHMRKKTQCVDATGGGLIEAHVTLVPAEAVSDSDSDGFSEYKGDCDDKNKSIHPGAVEICTDGIDNDCDELIDCGDSDCEGDPSCGSAPSETVVNVSADIPSYGVFSPNFQAVSLGSCSEYEGRLPAVFANSGPAINSDPRESDVLLILLNNDMGIGPWSLGSVFGPCDTPLVLFHTRDIRHENNGMPVVFESYAGQITLQAYGTEYGERLAGNFTVQVAGSQELCPTPSCSTEKEITGTISGSFDGIITKYNP